MTQRISISGTSPYEPIIGFSRAVRIGSHVYVSGTGPVGADEADVATQTDQCLTLIAHALKEAGSSIEHAYRTRVFLNRLQRLGGGWPHPWQVLFDHPPGLLDGRSLWPP